MRHTVVRGSIVAAVIATTAWSAVSCSLLFDRGGDAKRLDQQMRGMPGVADTDMDYKSDITNGERFGLTVMLRPDVTDQQVSDIGRMFVDTSARTGLDERSADLKLRYPTDPAPPKNNYATEYSTAMFSAGSSSGPDNPTADEVAGNAAVWLRAARSPATSEVTVVEPSSGTPAGSPEFTVTLRPWATSADATRLQASDPGLARASWGISVIGDETNRPHDYYSTPRPPTDAELDLWRQLSALVGVSQMASGRTTVPAERGKQAETWIEIYLPDGAGSEPDARRIAYGVARLVLRFDHPVQLILQTGDGTAELVVGGCYRHDAKHVVQPLEAELSTAFEKC